MRKPNPKFGWWSDQAVEPKIEKEPEARVIKSEQDIETPALAWLLENGPAHDAELITKDSPHNNSVIFGKHKPLTLITENRHSEWVVKAMRALEECPGARRVIPVGALEWGDTHHEPGHLTKDGTLYV